ncbi:MAG: DNA repair protein RadA [Dehalococcoidales bacterium]|nr:DNA repair protein RadA [Dehalococcoidales bacterium]
MSKDKPQTRTVFVCQQCGKESLKWVGHCPNCQAWNSFAEQTVKVSAATVMNVSSSGILQELSQVTTEAAERFPITLTEFNRVLGGGVVPGSLVLISGDPGIGKSTLLLQAAALVARQRGNVVYVSGEETAYQIKLRAERLGLDGKKLYLLSETNLNAIIERLEELSPSLVIIDSIQTVYLPEMDTLPGSITQVRECTMRLMQWAKPAAVPVFLSGHVTKEGAIAGPRVLEHIVDVVLYLEGEPFSSYRLLRCVKNRFGSTNEIGVFEMKEKGLAEITNPSQIFLSPRTGEVVGSSVVCTLEGSRPLLVEIQALTNTTSFGMPRRVANGVDFGRLLLITAVLSRRAGLKLGNQDIVVNVTGGLKINEPAADLGIALSIASSFSDNEVDPKLAVIGELGLSGELRAVSQLERRLSEVARLGFQRCMVSKTGLKNIKIPDSLTLIPAGTIREAILKGIIRRQNNSKTADSE